MKAKRLQDLANSLINEIKSKNDCFSTTTIAFPNPLVQQWFVSYWLETQGDAVLMNVEFKLLNDILPYLVKEESYKLIKKDNLTKVILSIISDPKENIIPKEVKKYYEGDAVKLNDFASSLAELYLDCYKDNFELPETGDFAYQKTLFDKIVDFCGDFHFGTIKKPTPKGTSDKEIFLFGFNKLDKIYRYLIDNCNFVKEYSLELDDTSKVDYTITNAPSMVREIEAIHSKICEQLKNGARVSDFYVVAPNIGDYENVIERVFRQNDVEYPSIPFVIRHHNKKESDVCIALKTLYRIAINGFFTRLDFYKLITNPIVQKVRHIDDDNVEDWMKTIIKLNIFRDHDFLDDWNYLRKRLLLSKVSSVNFEDNLVSLKDSDYLPYSEIGYDDENILKIVQLIDDLNELIKLVEGEDLIKKELVNEIKVQLDKWFSFSNGENETNAQYKKILNAISAFEEIEEKYIPLDVFFYALFESGTSTSVQKGFAFSQGITFADFDINSVVSKKYIFFIGASSNAIPVAKVISELDARKAAPINDDQETLYLLYQNSLEKFYVSYVRIDLKNEEEFYLSPIVNELNKREGKYVDENSYIQVDLDEKRPYSQLFTRKEFNDKAYFENLLGENNIKFKKSIKKEEEVFSFSEVVSTSNMEKFLKEPLMIKSGILFNYDEDNQSKIRNEWEPFELDHLTRFNLFKKVLFEMLNKTFDYEELLKQFTLNNKIPIINQESQEAIFHGLVESCLETYNFINDYSNGNYKLERIEAVKFNLPGKKEWILNSNDSYCLYENGLDRTYFELKEIYDKAVDAKEVIKLYIIALMDLSLLRTKNIYHVSLVRSLSLDEATTPNGDRGKWEFDITSYKATLLLDKIHDLMCDYLYNAFAPLKLINEDIEEFSDLVDETYGDHSTWAYFAHRNIFKWDKDLGYDSQNFKVADYYENVNRQIDCIIFLKRIEEEEKVNE